MPFCRNCGHKLDNKSKFCTSCGQPFLSASVEFKKKIPNRNLLKYILIVCAIITICGISIMMDVASDGTINLFGIIDHNPSETEPEENKQPEIKPTNLPSISNPTDCNHIWKDATCESPRTCSLCGTTTGTATEHTYISLSHDLSFCITCGKMSNDIVLETDVFEKNSYTVTSKDAYAARDIVVAKIGDMQLKNAELQIYYWSEVYDFLNNNSYYLTYYGLDYTKPLDEQICFYDKAMTWQQYFLQQALNAWHSNEAMYVVAKTNDFQLPSKEQELLDNMSADLEKQAKDNGYESADAMIQASFGICSTVEDYVHYMEVYYYGYLYFASEYEKIVPSTEEIENYFNENKLRLEEDGITQDSGNSVDVRHILMLIDNYNGNWTTCLAETQRVLDLWLTNPTEDYFAVLANLYSDDNDSEVTNGGIYEGITSETNFVKPFLDWCMNKDRRVGDYEIIQTDYGYHIMYFSAAEPIWILTCRNELIAAKAEKIVNDACDKYAPAIDYRKIVLCEVSI